MCLRKALFALLFVFAPSPVLADGIALGFAAPVQGPYAAVGKQMLAGAEVAALANDAALTVADEGCTPEGGAAAANQFIAAKVKAAAGFACYESLTAALPLLTKAGIPVLTTGVRADAIIETRTKTGFNVFRLGPADRMEGEALAQQLLERWKATPFAIIDDGTIHARDLAEELRAAATEKGLKPVFFDTFRPGLDNQSALARRLAKAGAMAVFMGGDVEDALVLAKNAAEIGLIFEIALGESALPSAEPAGSMLALALPDHSTKPTAESAVLALATKRIEPDIVALTAHAAVEVLAMAVKANGDVAAAIAAGTFKTVIGDVAFAASGERTGNPYTLQPLKAPGGTLAQ